MEQISKQILQSMDFHISITWRLCSPTYTERRKLRGSYYDDSTPKRQIHEETQTSALCVYRDISARIRILI